MRGNTGILLIAIGLLALYIVLSDKYSCFVQFSDCLLGNDYHTPEGYTRSDYPASTPTTGQSNKPSDVWEIFKRVMIPPPTIMVPRP